MNNSPILDRPENLEGKPRQKLFHFQLIEFLLVGLFVFLLLRDLVLQSSPWVTIASYTLTITILLFSAYRIYIEYKNALITGFGVVLKVILLMNTATIFGGLIFRILRWPYATEMTLIALMSFVYFVVYALILKSISFKVRGALFANALATATTAIGMMFRLENWANGIFILQTGLLLNLLTACFVGYLLFTDLTNKERYHAYHFISRSLVLLLFGFLFLVVTFQARTPLLPPHMNQ